MPIKPLVVANWKLYGSQDHFLTWSSNFKAPEGVVSVLCPPYPYLSLYNTKQNKFLLGAQDVSCYKEGAFTGDVSAKMLRDFSVSYTIVGHSERRSIFKETSEHFVQKIKMLQQEKVKAIFCVGESETERRDGLTEKVIKQQLSEVLKNLSKDEIKSLVIAYEPVWAIGTGLAATPEMASEAHQMIRDMLAAEHKNMSQSVQILYGGSVKPDNALAFAKAPGIDGALVGGASLAPESFLEICRAFTVVS